MKKKKEVYLSFLDTSIAWDLARIRGNSKNCFNWQLYYGYLIISYIFLSFLTALNDHVLDPLGEGE